MKIGKIKLGVEFVSLLLPYLHACYIVSDISVGTHHIHCCYAEVFHSNNKSKTSDVHLHEFLDPEESSVATKVVVILVVVIGF